MPIIKLAKPKTHLMLNVTVSSMTLCCTYFDSFFSSMPFLCSVAMKSVSGRDMRNCSSDRRPAKISGPCRPDCVCVWSKHVDDVMIVRGYLPGE